MQLLILVLCCFALNGQWKRANRILDRMKRAFSEYTYEAELYACIVEIFNVLRIYRVEFYNLCASNIMCTMARIHGMLCTPSRCCCVPYYNIMYIKETWNYGDLFVLLFSTFFSSLLLHFHSLRFIYSDRRDRFAPFVLFSSMCN